MSMSIGRSWLLSEALMYSIECQFSARSEYRRHLTRVHQSVPSPSCRTQLGRASGLPASASGSTSTSNNHINHRNFDVGTCHARSTVTQVLDGLARGTSARIDHNLERSVPSYRVALNKLLAPVCRRSEIPRPRKRDVDGVPWAQSHTRFRCCNDMLY